MITKEQLHELFDYQNGELLWKIEKKRGQEVGNFNSRGYKVVKIKGKIWALHRLIYLYHHGFIPGIVDHIDRNIRNNNIQNLRSATINDNLANRPKNRNNTSGYKGVVSRYNKWEAKIMHKRKLYYLGSFSTPEEAAKEYDRKALELQGEYACLNFPIVA